MPPSAAATPVRHYDSHCQERRRRLRLCRHAAGNAAQAALLAAGACACAATCRRLRSRPRLLRRMRRRRTSASALRVMRVARSPCCFGAARRQRHADAAPQRLPRRHGNANHVFFRLSFHVTICRRHLPPVISHCRGGWIGRDRGGEGGIYRHTCHETHDDAA